MKDKQKVKKANSSIIIIMIAIILATTIFCFWAYAKYQSVMNKTPDGLEVAKWNIDFQGEEITYDYDYVYGKKIAPGTTGQLNIEIEGESGTAFEYIVRLSDIKNKPKNLKFYAIKIKDSNGVLTDGEDKEENRIYFEDINDLRIDENGVIDPTTKTDTSADSNTSFLRNKDLGDKAIEAKRADKYESEYKANSRPLEIHWIWPYNNGDGENVVNGIMSFNQLNDFNNLNENFTVSDYDKEDTDDSELGKFGFKVTIIATQKRPGIHTPTIGDAKSGDIVQYKNGQYGMVIGQTANGSNVEVIPLLEYNSAGQSTAVLTTAANTKTETETGVRELGNGTGSSKDKTDGESYENTARESYNTAIDELNKLAKDYKDETYGEGKRALTVEDIRKIEPGNTDVSGFYTKKENQITTTIEGIPSIAIEPATYSNLDDASNQNQKFIIDEYTKVNEGTSYEEGSAILTTDLINKATNEKLKVGEFVQVGITYTNTQTGTDVTVGSVTLFVQSGEETNSYYNFTSIKLKVSEYSWLASRCFNLDSNNCRFRVRYLNTASHVGASDLFYSDGVSYSESYHVVPVVYLSSDYPVETPEEGSVVWVLK